MTDHQPIKWLHTKFTGKDLNPRLQRWLIQLGEYNMKVEYIKGKDNTVADFLSRINVTNHEINQIEKNTSIKDFTNDKTLVADRPTETNDDDISSTTSKVVEIGQNTNNPTIHSQQENTADYIPFKEIIVNTFKTQIILLTQKTTESRVIHKKVKIFIDLKDLTDQTNTLKIIKKYIKEGRIGIFSTIDDSKYYQFQKWLEAEFPRTKKLNFTRCTMMAKDLKDEEEAIKQISFFHKNELGHAGIIACYKGMKNIIYYPSLHTIITKVINNCDTCAAGKYDRKPIQPKLQESCTPTDLNQIIHMDIYTNTRTTFLNFIDKFSKHAIVIHLEDRHNQTIIEKLRMYFAIKGKPKKIVCDNEFKSLNIINFLKEQQVEIHFCKPNSHTGNSDVERFNNTITEKIRILNIEEKLPIKSQIFKALGKYNTTYHSAIKETPLNVQEGRVNKEQIYENLKNIKITVLNKMNEKKETYEEDRNIGFIRNYKSLRHKENPKYRKYNLRNIHYTNIKRPLKYSAE